MQKVTAGIDIGGTDTEVGVIDHHGKCFRKAVIITDNFPDIRDFIRECLQTIGTLCNEQGEEFELKGIGIAAPNGNHYRGTIEYPVNLKWKGVIPFVEIMMEYVEVPIVLMNDANAAAVGEKKFGAAKDMDNFIFVTLGTGLGSGIYVHGQLLEGHLGFASELGHVIIEEQGRMCNTGRRGCLEAYASVTGIRRTVFSLLAKSNEESELREVPFTKLTGEMITKAARNGDPIAQKAFDDTGRILGIALANVTALFDPEAIFLAGGLAMATEFILNPVQKHMEENVFPAFKGKVKILNSALLSENAGILGAGALAWEKVMANSKSG